MLIACLQYFFNQRLNHSTSFLVFLVNVCKQNKQFKALALKYRYSRDGVYLSTARGDVIVPFGDLSSAEVVRELEIECEYDIGLIQPSDIVLDLGANFGYFSRLISDRCYAVYAFEPNPYVFCFLDKNCTLPLYMGKTRIYANNTGISATTGIVEAAFKFHGTAAGSAVFLAGENKVRQHWKMLSPRDMRASLGNTMIDVVKFDCEGVETEVFCNAGLLDVFNPRLVFIEFHGDMARDALLQNLQTKSYTVKVTQKAEAGNGIIMAERNPIP